MADPRSMNIDGARARVETLDGAPRPLGKVGLADTLRSHTRARHLQAERSGIIRELLHGRADRAAYALFLRNLLAPYAAMESGLHQHRSSGTIGAFARPEVYRSGAIRSDLEAICGAGWESLGLLPSAERYARHITALSADGAVLLIAHAYVRYLGDLNGGQILKRIVGRSLELGAESLAFYDFPEIADLGSFTRDYRASFDESEPFIGAVAPLLEEADAAFRFNIELSEEVWRATV